MGRWIYEASPNLGKDRGGGADFFDREATEIVLPALLHAAALAGHSMAHVHKWLAGGGDVSFDRPAAILAEHGAHAALEQLRGVQLMHERHRGYALASARQLVDAYKYLSVLAYDADEFDVREFVRGRGTLYLCAPESRADEIAPIFGAFLGSILRAREEHAERAADPRRLPLLKIIADEAAHLAPLRKLATYLAVSRGWNVRWMVIYQSIAQLRQRYHHDADAILANTLLKFYLGPIHDTATREELIGLLGGEHVRETTHSDDTLGRGAGRSHRDAYRPKGNAEDLATLPAGLAIVIHHNDLPAITEVPFYQDADPASGERRDA